MINPYKKFTISIKVNMILDRELFSYKINKICLKKNSSIYFSIKILKFKIQFNNLKQNYVENSYFIKNSDTYNDSFFLQVNINHKIKSSMNVQENELNSKKFVEKKINEINKFNEQRLAEEGNRINNSKSDNFTTYINEIIHKQKKSEESIQILHD